MRYRVLETPTGPFAVCEDDTGALALSWAGAADERLAGGTLDPGLRDDLAARLARFFAGEPVDFSDVALPASSGVDGPDDRTFFTRCWMACRVIPRGRTRTYAELAAHAGSPGAARAAGQSMRRNPLPIVIPCHRVVGAGDRLGGFSGSDDPQSETVRTKRWLLRMEGALEPELF